MTATARSEALLVAVMTAPTRSEPRTRAQAGCYFFFFGRPYSTRLCSSIT